MKGFAPVTRRAFTTILTAIEMPQKGAGPLTMSFYPK